MKITLKVDPTVCITAANCVGVTPKFFRIGDEPYVELLDRNGDIAGTQVAYEVTPEELEPAPGGRRFLSD